MTSTEAALILDRLAVSGVLVEQRPIRRRYGRTLLAWVGIVVFVLGVGAALYGARGDDWIEPLAVTPLTAGGKSVPLSNATISTAPLPGRGPLCSFQNKRGSIVTFPQRADGSCNIEDARP